MREWLIRDALVEELPWVAATWSRNDPVRHWARPARPHRGRSYEVIAHRLERCRVLVATSAEIPDAPPFGWLAYEEWGPTVHFVYVRGRVPARDGMPASPSLRRRGIATALVERFGAGTWYTTHCARRCVPNGWRHDPWR
jgi:GNAT superfamily N-acetyltransferase